MKGAAPEPLFQFKMKFIAKRSSKSFGPHNIPSTSIAKGPNQEGFEGRTPHPIEHVDTHTLILSRSDGAISLDRDGNE